MTLLARGLADPLSRAAAVPQTVPQPGRTGLVERLVAYLPQRPLERELQLAQPAPSPLSREFLDGKLGCLS
jgi:hypothetical protein